MLRGADTAQTVRELVLVLLTMVLSLSVHECAHAWAAWRLGDDTAKRQGRLSLSPVTHVDVIGTLLVPALGTLVGGFSFIGWARPTPVSPARFTRKITMRAGEAVVAAAGPASNLVLAVIAIGVWALLERAGVGLRGDGGRPTAVAALVATLFYVNVGLCIFNLLPIPPLDGSRLLPRSLDEIQAKVAPYSFLVLILLLNVSATRILLFEKPFEIVTGLLQALFHTRIGGAG